MGRRVTHVAASSVAGGDHCWVHAAHTRTDGRVLANRRLWCIVVAGWVARANRHACWGEAEEGGTEEEKGAEGGEEKGGRGGGGRKAEAEEREEEKGAEGGEEKGGRGGGGRKAEEEEREEESRGRT